MPSRTQPRVAAQPGAGRCVELRSTSSPLACPYCHCPLASAAAVEYCAGCSREYPRSGRITSFLDANRFWQVMDESAVRAFLTRVEELGWAEAGRDLPQWITSYWFDSHRADFQAVLPRRTFEKVLDLGCGTGAIAATFASISDEVWGLDGCMESLRIFAARCQHEQLDRVHLVHGTATHLPFEERQFDLVVMNGVLERVGYAGTHAAVLESQRRSLSEAVRVLRPGGSLYIGIENRFGGNYLLGSPDEHTGLSYVNVLPRAVANRYSKLAQKREFTAFTHSYRGLSRMLAEAGFRQVQFWAPIPSYREIRLLEPLSERPTNLVEVVARQFPHRIPPLLVGLSRLVPTLLWRHLSPHFSVVARKEAGSR